MTLTPFNLTNVRASEFAIALLFAFCHLLNLLTQITSDAHKARQAQPSCIPLLVGEKQYVFNRALHVAALPTPVCPLPLFKESPLAEVYPVSKCPRDIRGQDPRVPGGHQEVSDACSLTGSRQRHAPPRSMDTPQRVGILLLARRIVQQCQHSPLEQTPRGALHHGR
jgi:hypothetical protein